MDASTLRAYLDNAATTPVLPEVARAMVTAMGATPDAAAAGAWANPSSAHRWGMAAAASVTTARTVVAKALAAQPEEVVFTSGGTEANELAILGRCRARRARGCHLVTTAIEHRSILDACVVLEREGWAVTRLAVEADGCLKTASVLAALRPDTVLCAFAHVNNEVGAVQPVADIAAALRVAAPEVTLHIDGVQAVGKIPTPYARWGVGTASLSAHKVGGPKGVGALWVRRGVRLVPPVPGGSQEGGLRPGTENVPGIVGLGTALELAPRWAPGLRPLKLELWHGLAQALPGLEANGPAPESGEAAPHILNLSFARVVGVPAEVLLHALEAEGIASSAGSACSARRPEPSHVLVALGLDPQRVRSSLRLSLGPTTGPSEIAAALAGVPKAVARLMRGPVRHGAGEGGGR